MGLDMYIYSQDGNKPKNELAYWRKLDVLHKWMFRNVRNISSEGGSIFVAKLTQADLSAAAKYMASLRHADPKFYYNEFHYKDVPKKLRCIRNAMKLNNHTYTYEADW